MSNSLKDTSGKMAGNWRTQTIRSILVPAVVLSLAGVSWAKYSGGTGEPNNPYRIATAEDLNDIGNHCEDFNDCFVLVNTINMAGFTYSTALIGPDTISDLVFQGTPFTGIFDGNDHAITNLTIDTAGAGNDYLGLFGQIGETAQVKNLGIEDVDIDGGYGIHKVGGLCAENYGTISNCYATGTVNGRDNCYYIGGLCGSNGNQGTIRYSYSISSLRVWYYSESIGGLCGGNRGTVGNCYSSGYVIASSYSLSIGGLCGENYSGTINHCYSSSLVNGVNDSYSIGGLCGLNDHFATISNCYSTGSVMCWDYCECVGGLCGENLATVTNCYSSGYVYARYHPSWLGALAGFNSYGTISDCYFLDGCGPDNGHGTPLADAQMKQQSSFLGWDFVGETANGTDEIWRMCVDGVHYPMLWWEFASGDFLCPDGVNFVDYSILAGHWADANCADSNDCDRTDLDFSGAVGWKDLKIFCDHWLEGTNN